MCLQKIKMAAKKVSTSHWVIESGGKNYLLIFKIHTYKRSLPIKKKITYKRSSIEIFIKSRNENQDHSIQKKVYTEETSD